MMRPDAARTTRPRKDFARLMLQRVLLWRVRMKQGESQPLPTPVSPVAPERTPEVQRQIDEFKRQIGPAMVKALNKGATDKK